MICNICHRPKPGYTVGDFFPDSQCLTDHTMSNISPMYLNHSSCAHCFCREDTDMVSRKKHKICCNCGTRKLKYDLHGTGNL